MLCQKEIQGLFLISHKFYIAVFPLLLAEQTLIYTSSRQIKKPSPLYQMLALYVLCTEVKTHIAELLR